MLMRTILSVLLALGGWAFFTPLAHASCVVETTGTYTEGESLRDNKCDTSGNLKVTTGGVGAAGATATATAAAPSYSEGNTAAPLSLDLSGNLRTTLGTLLSGEDQTNNLLQTSGGAVRVTQLVGTGGVPSTAADATTSATILPVGKKTFMGTVTCTGTCVQTQKIYGDWNSDAASGVLVCTIVMSASTTAFDYCVTDVPFSYWYVVTSLTSGTTPLAGLFAMY